ncbi:MAG: oligosaccharide flippase family protein [Candidatus Moraniibacteriota bacterium]
MQLGAGRILGPTEYGRFTLVITITLLLANLVGNGIPIAASKLLGGTDPRKRSLIRHIKRHVALAQALFIGGLTLVFFLLAPTFAALLDDQALAPLFAISAFIIPAYAADAFYFYYFSGIQRFAIQASLKLARSFLRVILILGLGIWFGLKRFLRRLSARTLHPFLRRSRNGFLARTKISERDRGNSTLGIFLWDASFRLALPMMAFLVPFEIFVSFDVYLIKYFFQDDQLSGWYAAALNAARIPTYLFYALTLILLPKTAEYFANGEHRKIGRMVTFSFRSMLIILIPGFALVSAFATSIMRFLYGPAFAEAGRLFAGALSRNRTRLLSLYFCFRVQRDRENPHPSFFRRRKPLAGSRYLSAPSSSHGSSALVAGKALAGLLVFPWFFISLGKNFGAHLENPFLSFVRLSVTGFIIFGAARFIGDSLPGLLIGGPLLFAAALGILFLLGEIRKVILRN